MVRWGIFSFYDAEGIVDEYVEYLLKDLSRYLSRLIIVINGNIKKSGKEKLLHYSKEIIVRDNRGFDAGGYKEALVKHIGYDKLQDCDELVLCNDTFFGPFVPFGDIFREMDGRDCDFWGISYANIAVMGYIQSYFLVFRRDVLEDRKFFDYWEQNIDEETRDINDVYARFERGLFHYLTAVLGKNFSSYIDGNICDIYLSCDYSIKKYNMPLLKKRAFEYIADNENNVMDALQHIMRENVYPIRYIIDNVNRVYKLKIKEKDIEDYVINKNLCIEKKMHNPEVTEDDLVEFINLSSKFYIYGTGIWAQVIYWLFCRENDRFGGFLVSDLSMCKTNKLYNHPVYQFEPMKGFDTGVIMGVNKDNTINIIKQYGTALKEGRLFTLFPSTLHEIMQ